jgi:hypothetical protein
MVTLPAGTAATVRKVPRIYVEDGCDKLYGSAYVPDLKDRIEFRYTIGQLPCVNDGREKAVLF